MSSMEETLKKLQGKQVFLCLANRENGDDHIYIGKLLSFSDEVLTIMNRRGKFLRGYVDEKIIINRHAFTILYIVERKE